MLRRRRFGRSRWPAALSLVAASFVAACDSAAPADVTERPPLTTAELPTGLALHPTLPALFVVSSNFDGRFESGALLVADLARVRGRLANGTTAIADAFVAGAYVPTFGHVPVVSADGAAIALSVRDGNKLALLDVTMNGSTPLPVCGESEGVPACEEPPFIAELASNDPYEVVFYSDTPTVKEGAVSFAAEHTLTFFVLRPERTGFDRVRTATLDLGPDVVTTRGMALLPATDDGDALLLLAVEKLDPITTRFNSDLLWLDPARADPSAADASLVNVRSFGLEEATGVASVRAVAATPTGDAALVVLRNPDGIARLELDRSGSSLAPRLGGTAPVCRSPVGVTVVTIPETRQGPVTRAIVPCFADDTVMVLDAESLTVTDVVKDFGRGPFHVVVDGTVTPPQAFVSFYNDGTIGIFDLVDEIGEPRLVAKGRIGAPFPEPEDGR